MTPAQAARLLGVSERSTPDDVRQAYRALIRLHHPDRAGAASGAQASAITEAYRVLSAVTPVVGDPEADGPSTDQPIAEQPAPERPVGAVARLGDDTIAVDQPPDEAFRLLLDAAHDIGEVTYLDRSMPILEVLCRFEGEPATSLVLTVQGRGAWTEVFATVESIEARPAPPAGSVVDLLELAVHRRRQDGTS